jgi:two-component system, cell cycle response regulator
MFKIKPYMLFGINILIMATSWGCYKLPQGDEYLFLFMISLVFVISPFVMSLKQEAALFFLNVPLLVFYRFAGILNWIDVTVFVFLFAAVSGASYLVRYLFGSFEAFQNADIQSGQRKYNSLVSELEAIDKRGKKIETELTRISRLYEITKKLAPALKFDDLLDALFEFLEENFRFDTAHLLICSGGEFIRGISKGTGGSDYNEDQERILDYKKVTEFCKNHDLNSVFLTREEASDMLDDMRVRGESLMVFPLFVGDELCAILAIEGAQRTMYGRFRILVSQIALEFRKVQLYERVQELSIIDGLTEVYLRRHLVERLEEEVDRAGRLGLTFSIGMVDVDHFKKCNDTYGHLVGDAVLKKIASRLKKSVREVDLIARYGGEEFCVVLPETNKELAMAVAQRLRRSVESSSIKAFDEEMRMTVSVGISTYPEDGTKIETLMEKADTALYKAKRKGRNKVCTT